MMRRIGVVAALLALVGSLLIPAMASGPADGGGSVGREVVVTQLDPTGRVLATSVLHLLRLDGSTTDVPRADLDDYRTLSGFDAPEMTADSYRWESADDEAVLALAGVMRAPPIDVDVSYALDGQRVSADDLKGAAGDVRIEIRIANTSGRVTTLEHDALTEPRKQDAISAFLPLEFSVQAAFPSGAWSDVQVSDGAVQPDGNADQIVAASGLLAPPLTGPSQTVVIEARSDRILLPKIRIFALARSNPLAASILDQQIEAVSELYGGVDLIADNLALVTGGVVDLAGGLEALVAGVGRLSAAGGTPELTLDADGDPATLLAALGVLGDTLSDRIIAGLGSIDPATGDPAVTLGPDGRPTTLLGALGFLERTIRADLLPPLGERDPETGRAVAAVDAKGRALTLLWGLQSLADALGVDLVAGTDETIAAVDALIASLSSLDPDAPGVREGLQAIDGGLGALVGRLDVVAPEPGAGFREALEGIAGLAQLGAATSTDLTSAAQFTQIGAIATGLLASLGERNPDGTPKIVLDGDGNPTTVIGTLGAMRAALGGQILAGIGARDPATGDPIVTLGPGGVPTTILGALGVIRDTALSNPAFDTKQAALGNRTPRAYFAACPACFDSAHPSYDPATAPFQPGFREAFELFAAGIEASIADLHSFDATSPGLVDGLEALADGVAALAASLHTSNPDEPGLVDGLEQVRGALDEIAVSLHTFDPDDPGLVDGLDLAVDGADRIASGLEALGAQGVGVLRAGLGSRGDDLMRDRATVDQQAAALDGYGFLLEDATSTAFLLEIAAQDTTVRDNAVRAGLIGLGLAALGVLRRRGLPA